MLVVAPAATVTELATGSNVLLLERATEDPPVGAAFERVTVQVVAAPAPRLVGLQVNDGTTVADTRLTVAVLDWLFSVAVSVTL